MYKDEAESLLYLYIEKLTKMCYNDYNERSMLTRDHPITGERFLQMPAAAIIKQRLKELNMTQTELAKAMGTTRQNFNNKMARDNFSTQELCQIGEILAFDVVIKTSKEEYPITY